MSSTGDMSSADDQGSSANRKLSAREANSPGWKLVDDRWLWWDGRNYTSSAGFEGQRPPARRASSNANIGMILFAITAVFIWVLGAFTGPVIVVLGAQARRRAQDEGESTTLATVVIVLGVMSFVLGLGMLALASSPDFEM